jgi:hypothetical protein
VRLRALARRRAPKKQKKYVDGLQIVRLRALARRRAPKITPHVAGLQTLPRFTPSPTPTRAEENRCR